MKLWTSFSFPLLGNSFYAVDLVPLSGTLHVFNLNTSSTSWNIFIRNLYSVLNCSKSLTYFESMFPNERFEIDIPSQVIMFADLILLLSNKSSPWKGTFFNTSYLGNVNNIGIYALMEVFRAQCFCHKKRFWRNVWYLTFTMRYILKHYSRPAVPLCFFLFRFFNLFVLQKISGYCLHLIIDS